MRAVNLLPRDGERRTSTGHEQIAIMAGSGGAALVLAVLAMMFLSAKNSVTAATSRLDDAKLALKVLPPPPPGPTAAQTQLASVQKPRLDALSAALTNRVAWDRVLSEISQVLPTDVWLTGLSATAPPPGGADPNAAPTGLTLSGKTYSQAAVARLLSRLELVPDLAQVQLQASLVSGKTVQFTLVANLRPVGSSK